MARRWGDLSPGEGRVSKIDFTREESDFIGGNSSLDDYEQKIPYYKANAMVIRAAIHKGLNRVAGAYASMAVSNYKYETKQRLEAYEHKGPCFPIFSRGLCKSCYQKWYRNKNAP